MSELGEETEQSIAARERRRIAEASAESAESLQLVALVLEELANDPHRYIDRIALMERLAARTGITDADELQERLARAKGEVERAAGKERSSANESASMALSLGASPPPPPGPPPADLGHPETPGGLGFLTK